MPFDHLISTFNARFMAEGHLKESPLSFDGKAVQGQFDGVLFGSTLLPMRQRSALSVVYGHDTTPDAMRLLEGKGVHLWGAGDLERLVRLDRLIRTVHMLNTLLQGQEQRPLFLKVHPLHLMGVKKDHGAYFEDIIRRCGLSLQRVVIVLSLRTTDQRVLPVLFDRFKRYRDRGYSLAIDLDHKTSGDLINQFCMHFLKEVRPDHVRLNAELLLETDQAGEGARQKQCLIERLRVNDMLTHVTRVESEAAYHCALRFGADTLEGAYIETLQLRTSKDSALEQATTAPAAKE